MKQKNTTFLAYNDLPSLIIPVKQNLFPKTTIDALIGLLRSVSQEHKNKPK